MTDPPEPPSAWPACDCRLSGSCESRSEAPDDPLSGGGLSETVPAIGDRTVRALTVRLATATAARVCTRCADDSAATASERLPRPAASWAAARSAAARADSYCVLETRSAERACALDCRSGMRRAARSARSNARCADASASRAPERVTGAPPPEPAAAALASARWAWRSVRRASGDSMRSSTLPARTCWPSRTRSRATVPDAAAVTVAEARALTVAGASTTSVTVARETSATRMPSLSPPLHAETSSSAATGSADARPTDDLTESS